ncbi:PD-(D/E)XK nuclease family protein [Natronorarus salvus]|uniref:hypothetical protein n=1 Tax=Natronorarus salvus TaxID=3117733 RepID=UPI002F26A7B0
MGVFVEQGSLESFLIDRWNKSSPHELGDTANGLCLLEGRIARQNLIRTLVSDSVPPEQAATYSSIEDLAKVLVRERYGQASILNRHIHVRLLGEVIESARDGHCSDELHSFAKIERLTEDTYLEELFAELNEYYRCTDAGEDFDDILQIATGLSDGFARHRSERTLKAFDAIHDDLLDRTASLPDGVFLSRSHLVREARHVFSDVWSSAFAHIEWVAVATVNILDNPTLRFFATIAELEGLPDIHFFFEEGTRATLFDRLANVGLEPVPRSSGSKWDSDTSAAGNAMLEVATGGFHGDHPPESVELIEAPDRRREIERLVSEVRELLAGDVSPQEMLVVARNVDQYRPIIEDVFTNNEIPYHVETRRPMAYLPSYRFVKATVDLIEAAVTDRLDVSHTEVTDPLRLGYCHPDHAIDNEGQWPMSDSRFLRIEQQLHAAEQDEGPRSIEDWLSFATGEQSNGDEWSQLAVFLEWVLEQKETPPVRGAELREFLQDLLWPHLWCIANDPIQSPSGPAVDPTRTDINSEHQTSHVERVRDRGETLEIYYDHILELFDTLNPSWNVVGQALGDVIGSEPFWSTNRDGNAVTISDAGLIDFRKAEHLFIVGLSTEEFPIELSTPTFTHKKLHEATARATRAEESDVPYLYYESKLDQYEQDLDSYAAALSTCTGELTLTQFYLDSENDPVAWSPFVDFLDPDPIEDEYVTRIRLDEWLPTPRDGESWPDTWKRASKRDLLRSYVFHAADVEHTAGPRIEQAEFHHLAFRTSVDPLEQFVGPRIDRYIEPIYSIFVDPDEPAFDGALSLEDIVGGPMRSHEIDLFAQCELKFYYYQLMFNFDGDQIERDRIPEQYCEVPTSRFGELPAVIHSQQADESFSTGMKRVISDLLPDRQHDLDSFASRGELRDWFQDLEPKLPRELLPSLYAEWEEVQRELDHSIDRGWNWEDDPDPVPISGTEVVLPPHRIDTLSDGSLPVFSVRERHYAERALKQCWTGGNRPSRDEQCDDLCQSCERYDDCSYTTKHILDHRLHTAAIQSNETSGFLLYEQGQTRPDARQGHLVVDDSVPYGDSESVEPSLRRITTDEYNDTVSRWRSDIEHHVRRLRPSPGVEFRTEPAFVTDLNGCENCVYRELCRVPLQEDRR